MKPIAGNNLEMKHKKCADQALTNLVVLLYSLFFTLCLPLVFLRLWYRSRKNPEYRKRWLERLGIFAKPNLAQMNGLWIHAVSVGESVAAAPLVHAFQKKYPNVPITVTTTTPTGSAQVKKLFGDSVFHVYFPYDLPWTFQRFLTSLRPKLCVIMETELWINALRAMKRFKVPCMIVNGRLSQKSMQGYERIGFVTRDMLSNITHVDAQSNEDGVRFIALGLSENRLSVSGNVKFDCSMPENLEEKASILRLTWGIDRPVWIAASTHNGEETEILAVFSKLKKEFVNLLLILVPRHPERFNSVADEIQKHGFSFVRRSQGIAATENTEIFLGDTMGELPLFYKAADIAFVGGSLVPIGGHNTLEPAALALPSIVGPYTQNFTEITKMLKEAGALVQASNKEDLISLLLQWLRRPDLAKHAGLQGENVVAKNKGAVEKILNQIQPYF